MESKDRRMKATSEILRNMRILKLKGWEMKFLPKIVELRKTETGCAVDAHTGSHLFKECLLGLLSSKTVIYVTHQVEFLPAADLILVLKDGRITHPGKYNDIVNSGTDFMELVQAHNKALSAFDSTEAGPASESTSTSKEVRNIASTEVAQIQENKDVQDSKPDETVESKRQIIQEEEREKGKVGFSVYWKYITMAYGGALVPLICLAYVLSELLQIGSNYWMAWATPVSQDEKPAASTVQSDIPYQVEFAFSIIHLTGTIVVMSHVAWQVFIVFIPVIATCIWYQVAICGTVGSGKSSLLSCILGEVPKITGTIKLCGTKAYVSQSPWIQSGKIEENILFGKEMERERYNKVLEACSLKKDLEILPYGDQTVIGERGINLSGGQKQRIQIARALYQDADIYLFDDPFSAVDAHTGSHLFKECLLGLLSSKTVIYVTHQVEFLPAADLILVLKDGRITQAGKYNDIVNSGTDFMELVQAHNKALSAFDSTEAGSASESTSMSKEVRNIASTEVAQIQENKDVQDSKPDETVESKRQIIQEEEREKGKWGFQSTGNILLWPMEELLCPYLSRTCSL
ncbi:ABC transporter C family member 3 [Morella rubra]|uniref:ABC-type xenobiotic transporter n=1 Tax=Morella rubra TaxID=262757 RepID=A0A6A1UJ18_9ROSI|nr:ABC transporter C family member 3 [Morella rubra]